VGRAWNSGKGSQAARQLESSGDDVTERYSWLREEMSRVKTRRFFVVDGPATDELRAAVAGRALAFPESYCDFVLSFGNAKLFRRHDSYLIGVLAAPRSDDRETGRLVIGHYLAAEVFYRPDLLSSGEESPVFEETRDGSRKAADSFDAWLSSRFQSAKRSFAVREWRAIEKGPSPFSAEELELVQERRRFDWDVLGVTERGALRFQIRNGSARRLPFLSVGIRTRDGRLEGRAWLDVSSIAPGESAIVEKVCYPGIAEPREVQAFRLPDPEPEDRSTYWEFRMMTGGS
jgi:hypothetical protein